jgi:signal transduction histidine kinase
LKNKQIRVEIACNKEIELYSYPGAFAQVISNLLLNSLTHGFDNSNKGEINVLAKIKDDNLSLTYKDNGKGIPPEIRNKITCEDQVVNGAAFTIVLPLATGKKNESYQHI